MKDFDSLLEAAFQGGLDYGRHEAGVNMGVLAASSLPDQDDAYWRWRKEWAGQPHEDPDLSLPDDLLPPTHPRGQHGMRFQGGSEAGCYG